MDEVVLLAKRYGITTPYTSYLVVPDGPMPVAQAAERARPADREGRRALPLPGAGAGAAASAGQGRPPGGRRAWPDGRRAASR